MYNAARLEEKRIESHLLKRNSTPCLPIRNAIWPRIESPKGAPADILGFRYESRIPDASRAGLRFSEPGGG
jgi:hypothetical protein